MAGIFNTGLLFWGGCSFTPGSAAREDADSCAECHTSPNEVVGWQEADEFTIYGQIRNDAHKSHLMKGVPCSTCHDVPENDSLYSHITWQRREDREEAVRNMISPRADVRLQRGQYNSADKTCTGGCHVSQRSPFWNRQVRVQLGCGDSGNSCHRPTTPPHDEAIRSNQQICSRCHQGSVNSNGTVKPPHGSVNEPDSQHMDGIVQRPVREVGCGVGSGFGCHDYPPQSHTSWFGQVAREIQDRVLGFINRCMNCHPERTSSFRQSPTDTHRNGQRDFKPQLCTSCHPQPPATGAHARHNTPTLISSVPCSSCHGENLPTEALPIANLFQHMAQVPRVVFNLLRPSYAPTLVPTYAAGQCINIYCHGGGLPEGQRELFWSGAAVVCGDCHGIPPSPLLTTHYSEYTTCPDCHTSFPARHIDGEINVE